MIMAFCPMVEGSTFKEDYFNKKFCDSINGDTETYYKYSYNRGKGSIKIDCETSRYVYEGGLDKRSSLDSVQQAVFFSILTGKKPAVVIYNTDGKEGIYEYRIRKVCNRLGILFINPDYGDQ